MFPLAGKSFPTTTQQLIASIQTALAAAMTFPANSTPVKAEGGSFPAIDQLTIDLSGARVNLVIPPPPPKVQGGHRPGITVSQLHVLANPIFLQQSKAQFELSAAAVRLDFATDARDNPLLLLASARDGKLSARVEKSDFSAMLLAAANVAAKTQGIAIQDLQVDLQSNGPRSLSISARVKAKKLMMSGVITVRGRAELDDQMTATLSGLSCSGEGMIGHMAAGLVQNKLNNFDGKRFPLMALSLGEVKLHDVNVQTTPSLRLDAAFGN